MAAPSPLRWRAGCSAPDRQVVIETCTITTEAGIAYTGLAYEYQHAGGYGSGDWLMLDRQAGWWLIPHYRIVSMKRGAP